MNLRIDSLVYNPDLGAIAQVTDLDTGRVVFGVDPAIPKASA